MSYASYLLIMNEMEPKEILKEARELAGITQTEMADRLAKKLNQTYSLRQYQRVEEGIFPKFKREVVEAIDEILNLNLCDIIYDKNVPRDTLLHKQAQDNTKTNYLRHRQALKNSSGPYMVPLVPVSAQAGYAKNYYDMAYLEKLDLYPILPGVDPHGAIWRYFQVKGKSMEDTLMDEQYILVSQVPKDDWKNLENSYVYVFVTDEGVTVKRLFKVKSKDYWAAISDNPDETQYPQFRVYVKEVKELWKFRRKVDWEAKSPRKVEIKV